MINRLAKITCLFAWILVVSGCANQKPANPQSSTKIEQQNADRLPPGIHNETMVSSTGDTIRYTIAIPNNYDSANPTPLIVALHFGGTVTPHFGRAIVEVLVAPGLEELQAIIISPDSIAGPWNNEKNENAVIELMDYAIDNYNIDRDKTLLTGFSMGGHGTWYIGSRNQKRFSALIPIAGSPIVENGVQWSTPIYAIHSRADKVVPIGPTEKYMDSLKEDGHNIVFVAVDDLTHFQTPSFSTSLRDAVPWVRKVWSEK